MVGGGGETSFLHLITQIQASEFLVCSDADRDEKLWVQVVQTQLSFQHQHRGKFDQRRFLIKDNK